MSEYTTQNFQSGEILLASKLNAMDAQIKENSDNLATVLDDAKAYVNETVSNLDVSDEAKEGEYVAAVNMKDGKIEITRSSLPQVDLSALLESISSLEERINQLDTAIAVLQELVNSLEPDEPTTEPEPEPEPDPDPTPEPEPEPEPEEPETPIEGEGNGETGESQE